MYDCGLGSKDCFSWAMNMEISGANSALWVMLRVDSNYNAMDQY